MKRTGHVQLLLHARTCQRFAVRNTHRPAGAARGGYVLAGEDPEVILMATGSELSLAVEAHEQLSADGIRSRVVSMPSLEIFEDQPQNYRDEVLPPSVTARVAVEAGVRQGWDRYIGMSGAFVGLDDFGASAPYAEIYKERGLTVESVVTSAKRQLGRS